MSARVLASRWLAGEQLADTLTAAAIAHDVGYAAMLTETGHHAVDGARYLQRLGFDEQVVSLVAWHSTGTWELPLIGIDLNNIVSRPRNQRLRDLLWLADFTTSPTGIRISVEERVDGIRDRYVPDSTPVEALDESAPELDRIVAEYGREG